VKAFEQGQRAIKRIGLLEFISTLESHASSVRDVWCAAVRDLNSSAELSDAAISTYVTGRLREVLRKSVLNEASALRNFCKWLHETHVTPALLVAPTVSKSLSGRRYHTRRRVRAPDLSPQEIERLLAALPLKSRWGHAVRARFVLMFDTTLRPTTLDKLTVPENWARGEVVLRVRDDDDKEGFGREVPSTDRASSRAPIAVSISWRAASTPPCTTSFPSLTLIAISQTDATDRTSSSAAPSAVRMGDAIFVGESSSHSQMCVSSRYLNARYRRRTRPGYPQAVERRNRKRLRFRLPWFRTVVCERAWGAPSLRPQRR
jgi:hypothetical protein